ncbi:FAD-dependent oxidoreductase [Pseudochelatococcus sp. G4_1912]|uniref:FAD-dependent oxidoreductase n=1 Tax=Pseudochelatococcus sp. G4_1912 TaxID=3114288 RepID=UPI0039C6C94A
MKPSYAAISTIHRADLCVVGSGYGGRLIAIKAAESSASVVHVSPPGDHLNLSAPAISTRAFIEAANQFHTATRISTIGSGRTPTEASSSYALNIRALLRHVHKASTASPLSLSDERLRALQVSIVTGEAHFENAKTLRVRDKHIVARRFVLAPENNWIPPAIPGLEDISYLTPDKLLVASYPIERLIVIGTSAAAFALAQAHRRLGAWVALIPTPDFNAASVEDEITRQILMALEYDGVSLRLDTAITQIEARGNEAIVYTTTGEALAASHVLIAPALHPIFPHLGWEQAKIVMEGQLPALDDRLRTSNHRIHVIGGAITDNIFSTALEDEANQIINHAVLRKRPAKSPIIHIVPTTPEIATVGLDEERARQLYGKINIVRRSFAMTPLHLASRFKTGPIVGEIKVIVTRRNTIVGCTIIGDGAADIAGLWTLAIARRLKVADLANLGFPDLSHHSITREAVRVTVFGWPKLRGTLLRLSRWWRRIWN